MSHFIQNTMSDIREGRESWRIFTAFGTLAFTVAIAMKLI
jgi:hypothetical protein